MCSHLTGICHTRWAAHGGLTEHTLRPGRRRQLAVIHNGKEYRVYWGPIHAGDSPPASLGTARSHHTPRWCKITKKSRPWCPHQVMVEEDNTTVLLRRARCLRSAGALLINVPLRILAAAMGYEADPPQKSSPRTSSRVSKESAPWMRTPPLGKQKQVVGVRKSEYRVPFAAPPLASIMYACPYTRFKRRHLSTAVNAAVS